MAEIDSRYVYRGLWVDHSKGPVLGQTITTDTRTSTIVIALLAVLSSLGATHLWYILLFLYHQLRANGKPADGLYRQQQAVLRSLPPPSALAVETTKLWWAWRNKGQKIFLRCFIPAGISMAFSVGLLFASVFSAYIVTNNELEVLVSSPFCGFINRTRFWTNVDGGGHAYRAIFEANGGLYARSCYNQHSNTTLPSQCNNIFVQPNIWFSKKDTACPFDGSMCEEGSTAFEIDSGRVDMRSFGFNLPSDQGVKFRRKTTCSVLPIDDHIKIVNGTEMEEFDVGISTPKGNFALQEFVLMMYGGYSMDKDTKWQNLTDYQSLWRSNNSQAYEVGYVLSLSSFHTDPFRCLGEIR